MADNIYRCEACGGVMEFDVNSQKLKCPNCETEIEIINDETKIVEHELNLDLARTIKPEEKTTKTLNCSGCGASIEMASNETAAECPYCGSNYVLAEKQTELIVPDGVVPFKLDKIKVQELFKTWIKKRWLAPGEFKNLYQHGGFQGIYVPYWTFDAQADCHYTGEGGKDRKVKYKDSEGNEKTKIETDWYYTSGRINHFFDDVQVAASTRFKGGFFKGIEPFDFKQVSSYSPEYISGYLSENYTIGLEDGHKEAISQMKSDLRSMAENDIRRRYDRARNVRISPRFYDETYKHLLLPVYSTSYQFKGKTFNVLINGQTGIIKGEYPKSPIKIAILIVLILAVAGLIFYFTYSK